MGGLMQEQCGEPNQMLQSAILWSPPDHVTLSEHNMKMGWSNLTNLTNLINDADIPRVVKTSTESSYLIIGWFDQESRSRSGDMAKGHHLSDNLRTTLTPDAHFRVYVIITLGQKRFCV